MDYIIGSRHRESFIGTYFMFLYAVYKLRERLGYVLSYRFRVINHYQSKVTVVGECNAS